MKVVFSIKDNEGYNADQVSPRMTLGEFAGMVEEAVNTYGEDAEVVTFNLNNPRGASWGFIDDEFPVDVEEFEPPESWF